MSYEAWRISFQDSEQAARAAFEEASKLRRERDALAAHVERWKDWFSQDVEDDDCEWFDDGWNIHRESPESSVAKHDARVAINELSETIDRISADVDNVHIVIMLRERITVLRREADAILLCRFHGFDTEACETYSGQAPCEPEGGES